MTKQKTRKIKYDCLQGIHNPKIIGIRQVSKTVWTEHIRCRTCGEEWIEFIGINVNEQSKENE